MPPPSLIIGMVAVRSKTSPREYCVYIGTSSSWSANQAEDCERIAERGARVDRAHAIAVMTELPFIEEREGLEYRV